jgi:hypothetical protein
MNVNQNDEIVTKCEERIFEIIDELQDLGVDGDASKKKLLMEELQKLQDIRSDHLKMVERTEMKQLEIDHENKLALIECVNKRQLTLLGRKVSADALIAAGGVITAGTLALVGKIYAVNKVTKYEDDDEIITSKAYKEV